MHSIRLRLHWRTASSVRKSRGQSLVEFALVLPLLMVILLFTVDFGRVFLGWVELNNAARIAANYAAAGQPPLTSTQRDQYRAIVGRETAALNCDLPTVNPIPDPTFTPNTSVGSQAVVNLSCVFHPITPFISGFFGGGVNVGAQAIFPIRAGVLTNLGGSGGTTYVAPNQDFTVTPATGNAPLTVNLGLGTQNGGLAQTYAWNFGDPSSGANNISSLQTPPQHVYGSAGAYTVTLVETNTGGTSPTYSHTVTVTSGALAPVASFYGLVPAPCVDSGAPLAEACGGGTGSTIYYRFNPNPQITFYSTSQNVSGATYAWDFGDPSSPNNTSSLQTPTHTYTEPGAFTVTLTVTTASGTNTATRSAYIHLGCIMPNFAGVNSSDAGTLWTNANFLASNLLYYTPAGPGKSGGGTYVAIVPSSSYKIQQQNPQAPAFFDATAQSGTYACTTVGRVAPANADPTP